MEVQHRNKKRIYKAFCQRWYG